MVRMKVIPILSGSWINGKFMKRLIRYGIISGIATLLYFGVLVTLVEAFGVQPAFSAFIGFLSILLLVYLPHHFWVFRSTQAHYCSFPKFVIVGVFGLLANAGVMYCAVNIFNLNYMWGIVGATAVVPPTNFLLNFYWTFR